MVNNKMTKRIFRLVLLSSWLWALGLLQGSYAQIGDRPAPATAGEALSEEESRSAQALAEGALHRRGRLRRTGRTPLVQADLYRDKEGEKEKPPSRRAMVTHYRYDDDAAIVTILDLTRQEVVRVEEIPHLPVPLSLEEFERARELAFSDASVRSALPDGGEPPVVEALLIRGESPDDPIFGHRVVRLLFRHGADYLSQPTVTVDLTDERVRVEEGYASFSGH